MKISLSSILFDRAHREPERTAILTAQETIRYGELATEAAGIAALLHAEGLQGRRISLLLQNIPRFASLLHGVLAGGGTAVMTNPMNSPREVREQLEDAEVAAVVTTAGLRPLLPAGIPMLLVDHLPTGVLLVRDGSEHLLPLPRTETLPAGARGGDDEAAILFTSADRGRARGAVLSHRNLIANLRSTVEMMGLRETDRMLSALPQVHAFGLTVGLNAPLAAGATVLPVERFHPARALETLATLGPTVFAGVPAMFMAMLSVAERAAVPEHLLRLTLSGGAPVHPDVQRAWEDAFGIPLRQGYGLTEASPVCLFNAPERPNRPGTLGREIPRVEVTIQDASGARLGPGEVGEICVRGENVFAGYLDGARLGDPPFRDEWLRTGDLGSRDADGYVRFLGILKPMFTRAGFNVYPREVERVLEEDPRIARARVRAQPDAARENELILEIERAAGATLEEDEVRELCRAGLASYKQPGRILFA